MALLTAQQITTTGLAPVYSAVAASDTIQAGAGLFLHVKNAGGSPDTVTLVDAGVTPGGSAATSPTVTVPATTGDRMIAIPSAFANTGTGLVTVNHSSTASVTAALIRGV
jgi:hypothetical protein